MNLPLHKVIFTGRMRVGKDYVSELLGLTVLPLAEPLYEMCSALLGSCEKENPQHRQFLQMLGAWGRGEPKEDSPRLPTFQEVTSLVNSQPEKLVTTKHLNIGIQWSRFGTPEFWLNIALLKAQAFIKENPNTPLSVPNGRFANEVQAFTKLGFLHLHVRCSEPARLERLGPRHDPASDNDITEAYSRHLDETLFGPTVIWNDHRPTPNNTGYAHIRDWIWQRQSSCPR